MRPSFSTTSTPLCGVLVVLGLGLLTLQVTRGDEELAIRWVTESDPGKAHVEVTGIDPKTISALRNTGRSLEEWQAILPARVDHEDVQTALRSPPMLGRYMIEGQTLQFHPQFELQRGLSYRATLHANALPNSRTDARKSARFDVPRRRTERSTTVANIFPSSSILPENLLKFYVHFSAPMSRGGIYDHIQLTDSAGKVVEIPFLEIDEELWSPDMTRVTLFIDPGRIKRGVKPLEDIGPSLVSGNQYTLTISADWQDAEGLGLKEAYEKVFTVRRPDRTSPDPKTWKVSSPAAGSRDPLTIVFPEPMDSALAKRLITVKAVEGTAELKNEEREWAFVPSVPWKAGKHALLVHNIIEDLAGNNIGKTFEVDIFEKIDDGRIRADLITLPFNVD